MSADPQHPKVGDKFLRVAGDEATVTAVGRDSLLFLDRNGNEMFSALDIVSTCWQPAPEPLITEPLTLWRQTYDGIHTWSFSPCWGNASITILPGGTWQEGHDLPSIPNTGKPS